MVRVWTDEMWFSNWIFLTLTDRSEAPSDITPWVTVLIYSTVILIKIYFYIIGGVETWSMIAKWRKLLKTFFQKMIFLKISTPALIPTNHPSFWGFFFNRDCENNSNSRLKICDSFCQDGSHVFRVFMRLIMLQQNGFIPETSDENKCNKNRMFR